MRLIFSALIDQFAITSVCCLLMSGICSRVVTALITDQHCGIPGPLSRLCVSQHGTFCLTPGGNTGAITVVTTHTRVSDIRRCSMQTPLSPPALACLSSLSTHRQHHHQHGPVSGTSETLCHKHQDIMCVGLWDRVSP